MANGPLTLLDIAVRNGNNVATVVEDVVTVAPEWGIIPATQRTGISYDVLRRIGNPHGQFRRVGTGVPMLKSEWDRDTKPMFYFDCQMNVGQDIVQAQTAQSKATVGDILADEAMANVRGSSQYFGEQTWYGQSADPNGFFGAATMLSSASGSDLSAGGGPANTSSAYLCWLDPDNNNPKGLHYLVGLDGTMTFPDWQMMQSLKGTDGGGRQLYATSWYNGFSFYCGLNVGSDYSVFRIKNIDLTHPLTDALGAALVTAVPLGRRQNLRWFMNRYAAQSLQTARAAGNVSVVTPGVPGGGIYAALPTELAGFPITLTDSLSNVENAGVFTPAATFPTDDIH